jgi:hypothetical protein
MSSYQLTATLDDKTVLTSFIADDDADAMMEAIYYIMDEAYNDKLGPWAKGRIELTDPNGDTINTMEAKS